GDDPAEAHLRVVADALEQAVGDARRAAAARGDRIRPVGLERHVEDARRAGDDRREIRQVVVLEAVLQAEAIAQRRGQQARARRLAEPRRAGEQDVVERVAARDRGLDRDRQLLLERRLADEVLETPRPQRAVELELLLDALRGLDARVAHLRLSACGPRAARW